MMRWKKTSAIAACISVAAGIMFGLMPRNWIELRLGINPDGGSGLLEFLLVSIPIAICVGLAILAVRPPTVIISAGERTDSALP